MKILLIKKFLPILLLIIIGNGLIIYSDNQTEKEMSPYSMHEDAEKAIKAGDPNAAYILYVESSIAFQDPHLKSIALCDAATVGWTSQIADYETLVNLYSQALRYDPENYEASFNLEYLYYLKEKDMKGIPEPLPGDKPTREEEVTSGDV